MEDHPELMWEQGLTSQTWRARALGLSLPSQVGTLAPTMSQQPDTCQGSPAQHSRVTQEGLRLRLL